MTRLHTRPLSSLILLLIAFSALIGLACADPPPAETVWDAIEIQGKLVGYSKQDLWPADEAAGSGRRAHAEAHLQLTALGQPFDIRITADREWDAKTGKLRKIDLDILRGKDGQKLEILFSGSQAKITPAGGGDERTVDLPEEAIVEDDLDYSYVLQDLGEDGPASKTYQIFEPIQGKLHEKIYTRTGRETLNLAGKPHDCLVCDVLDKTFGIKARLWIDRTSARSLRFEASNGVVSYLADATVKDLVSRGDIDSMLFGKVDVAIPNFQELTRMKVQAELRTAGEWVTAESLTVGGQHFTGTVEENLVKGVFEIAWPRYDGRDAPPFPADWSKKPELKKYLEPEDMVESDAPEIIEKARQLTEGAKDSWDAAKRLSKWVAEEIGYEIPGGSAKHTLETHKGECGSHSRLLTALCRAVGIPARIVAGGFYNPLQGGSFGQHAWNEIYLGPAGWVPVDSTAREVDYLDAGHIRLGELVTFNPVKMKILDYQAGSRKMGEEPDALTAGAKIPWEAGKSYTYHYVVKGNQVGTETMTITTVSPEGAVTAKTHLAVGQGEADIDWALGPGGAPRSYHVSGTARGAKVAIDCKFEPGKVEVTVDQGDQHVERSVELPEGVRLIDNNNLGLMSLLLVDAPEKEGETRAFKVFHPSSTQLLSGEMTNKGLETIDWNGSQVLAQHIEMTLAGTPLQFWLDEQGRLLRNSQGGGAVVVELEGLP